MPITQAECCPKENGQMLGQLSGWSVEVLVYCLLNARIRPLASHYANEMQRPHDLRRVAFFERALAFARMKDEKIFELLFFLFFQSSNFEVFQIALIARATFPLVHLARTCRPVTAARPTGSRKIFHRSKAL